MTAPIEPEWHVLEADDATVRRLAGELQISPLTARLLTNRNIVDTARARAFLGPRLSDLPDPYLMTGMEAGVARIVAALDKGQRVTVWGDYDVDGVTSASQLLWFFRAVGGDVDYFVPDRFTDGYGLNGDRIAELAERGTELLITVDCGISNGAEVARANSLGMDVVVVDHHQCPPELPPAVAILNPHQPGCAWPDKDLAACGVTWVLLVGLRKRMREHGWFAERPEPDLRRWLDLTAIGTVADMVPLLGVNRLIVRYGLGLTTQGGRAGVMALAKVSRLGERKRITTGALGFQFGPRINAAGRIAHASAGVELLTTEDPDEALLQATRVDAFNQERRGIQEAIFAQACELADALEPPPADRRSIVLAHPEWHPGVLGIVASKLVERYYRPTILLTIEDGKAKGSARSVGGFKLVEALREVDSLLEKYGGHDHAAGMTLASDQLEAFTAAFEARAQAVLGDRDLRPRLKIDCHVPISQVGWSTLDELRPLEPYGMANREPVFADFGVTVLDSRVVGKDETHLKLTLDAGERGVEAIAFGMAHKKPEVGSLIDIAYVPDQNEFRGERRFQLRVKALRPA